MRLPVINQRPRECGTCTLCCKVMEVRSIDKPKDEWCPDCLKKGGCGIYATRPVECQNFVCQWLVNQIFPASWKPDRIHGVLTATVNGENLVLHEDPGYPGYASGVMREFIQSFINIEGGRYFIVVCGEDRRLIAPSYLLPHLKLEYDPTIGGTRVYDDRREANTVREETIEEHVATQLNRRVDAK